jgi:serine/threonine-protein kinase
MRQNQPKLKSQTPGEPTRDYLSERGSPAAAPRCKVALVGESSPHLTREIERLLHGRLLLAALITLAAFAVFLGFTLLIPGFAPYATALDNSLEALVVAVVGVVAFLLWQKRAPSIFYLRALEAVLFGTTGLFFAWCEFNLYYEGKILESAIGGHEPIVAKVAAVANSMRWFILIVIYGTFIPNTWRRCAAVVGVMALSPLVLMAWIAIMCNVFRDYLPIVLLHTTILVGLAAAIAVFGSYKISTLRQEAFEARQMGQYRLKRRLGRGGMGEVYLGEHVFLRRPCAIKLIRPEQAIDARVLARFEREVQATATLTHWNTVEIYDYGHTEDGTFYYVMEYLPGLSLQQLVDEFGPLPPERAVHLLRQVVGAVREAHAIGLIHRDIKPSNILACERGQVYDVAKLVDFGIVHRQGIGLGDAEKRLTMEGSISGSPAYLSPEQAVPNKPVDARTDIYGLGGVAYFLLTARTPFERESAMEMLMAHVYEVVTPLHEFLPDVPPDLEEVVMRCLEKDPNRRYPDADALARALAECHSAGAWTQEQAARWWRKHVEEPAEAPAADPGQGKEGQGQTDPWAPGVATG